MAEERYLEVRRLVLRMQGTDTGRAARLAQEVGERMASERLGESARPGAHINVKVETREGQSTSVLAERVAAAVRRALR